MTRRTIAGALLAVVALTLQPAQATHPTDGRGCPMHLADASVANPNLKDGANEWDGVVTGNGSATVPYGDVYREGTDLIAAWITREQDGHLTVHLQTQTLSETQVNSIFYFLWQYAGSSPAQKDRFVSAKLKGYGVDFFFGYLGAPNPAGVRSFITEGSTTGRLVPGTPGEIVIDVPTAGTTLSGAPVADWGAPATGSRLAGLLAEARVLLGSPESLPPNPTGLRSGLVGVADDTGDALKVCDAYVEP